MALRAGPPSAPGSLNGGMAPILADEAAGIFGVVAISDFRLARRCRLAEPPSSLTGSAPRPPMMSPTPPIPTPPTREASRSEPAFAPSSWARPGLAASAAHSATATASPKTFTRLSIGDLTLIGSRYLKPSNFGEIRFVLVQGRLAAAAPPVQEQGLQRRHHHQEQNRTDQHAADHHGGERALHLAADSGRDRGREQADASRQCHHHNRPHLLRNR